MTLLNRKGVSVLDGHTNNEKRSGTIYEELSTVKLINNDVIIQQSLCVNQNVVVNNMKWRAKTYESFQKKVHLVAEDYTGGVDENNICIESPIIMDLLDENGEPEADAKVIVSFAAKIPTNIGRKDLQ